MTAAEKAKELVNERFYQPLTLHLNVNNNSKQMWAYANLCASIAVNEVLTALMQIIGDERHMWSEHELSQVRYWESVVIEIGKL
jgi:hypothetical protein